MTPADLIAFETEIADLFKAKKIHSPIHLNDGCEEAMIECFKHIRPTDWVCCSWRSHYQCLLKGVPRDEVIAAIIKGRSIAMCFPEHRIVSSAIVGGIIPIAVGIAMAGHRVHCWVGDMTAETGIFHESSKYDHNFNLPIRFIIEDNQHSVATPTHKAWGKGYRYKSKYPHAGSGEWIKF